MPGLVWGTAVRCTAAPVPPAAAVAGPSGASPASPWSSPRARDSACPASTLQGRWASGGAGPAYASSQHPAAPVPSCGVAAEAGPSTFALTVRCKLNIPGAPKAGPEQ